MTRRSRSRSNMKAPRGLQNKRMDRAVYSERRVIMGHIYEARRVLRAAGIELPRVDVRICEDSSQVNGCAELGGRKVWIAASALDRAEGLVRRTVWHELCHAVLGTEHIPSCPLMHAGAPKVAPTKATLTDALLGHFLKG